MPQADSQYLEILNNVQVQIQALALTYNNAPVAVLSRKIPRWLPNISLPSLPIILIAADDKPEQITPWSSENEVLAKYSVTIVVIAAGNQDMTANFDVWLGWREQLRRLFQWGMQTQLKGCLFSEYEGSPPLLRDAVLKNYDVSGFGFRFWNVEPAINAN